MQPFPVNSILLVEAKGKDQAMNKEEIIKKLENLDLPSIVIHSHQQKLGKALLDAVHLGDFQRTPASRNLRQRALDSILGLRHQPVWKIASASLVACTVVAALVIVIPLLTAASPTNLALQIARNDPQILETLHGDGDVNVLDMNISGRTANVVCTRGLGDILEASIDLDMKKVVSTKHLESLFVPELTEAARTHALNIAMDDPRVKQILERGGNVGRIFPSFSSVSSASIVGNSMVKILPATNLAILQIESEGKSWLVQIDLDEKQVENIIEPQLRLLPEQGRFNNMIF
jgi:hypothetical protein